MTPDQIDKTGLVREAYAIEGITDAECRSIFVDWAMKLPQGIDPAQAIAALLETYAQGREEHPMTKVLRQGLRPGAAPRRRGGRRGRGDQLT